MKSGIRILALDDSRINRMERTNLIVGVVGRKGMVEGVLSFRVGINGDDATDGIINSVRSSRFIDQIRLIAINGTTFAGMNVIDIGKIRSSLGVPVIGITRKKPHPSLLRKSIGAADITGKKEKAAIIGRIAKQAALDRFRGFYVQRIGIEATQVERYIESSTALLRLAHMIASGVTGSESRGRV